MKRFCGLFGHDKKYVGIEDIVLDEDRNYLKRACAHGNVFLNHCRTCGDSLQVARWVCECGVMGETYIKIGTGIFKAEFGKLVPDEKRWANHVALIPR